MILIAGGIGVTLAALAYGRQAAEEAFDKLLAGAVFEMADSISVTSGGLQVDVPVSAFEMMALAPDDRVFYRVLNANGETLTGYDNLPPPPVVSEGAVFYNGVYRGEVIRLAAKRRVFVEQAFSGELLAIVAQTTLSRSELAWDITRNALIIVGVAGLVLVLLTFIAVRTALSPLERIERALLQRDPLDLTPLDVAAPREVATMVEAIDRFMGRLSRRVTVMQGLIADATHQLRTPVAALRAQAELATEEDDPAHLRDIVRRIHRRSVGLSRLTDQLLNQALIIHRADAVPRQPVDLRQVAIRVAAEVDHDYTARGEQMRLDLPEEQISVLGDELSLVEATKNLVNNAYRYGKAPVTLSVSLPAIIAVTDRGPGIAEQDWPDIGRRFSKASGTTPDSAGLGLAIVTSVAEAHGGELVLGCDKDGHFTVSLKFLPVLGDAS